MRERIRGEIVRIVDGRGFGFVKVWDGRMKDLFLHCSEVNVPWDSIAVGTLIEFEERENGGKLKAVNAVVVGQSDETEAESLGDVPRGYVSGRAFGKGL